MIRGSLQLFSERDLDRLNAAVLRILERTGIKVHSDEFLSAVERCGAKVDAAGRIARFPAPMVEALIADRRGGGTWLPARERGEPDPEQAIGLCGVIAPFFHDHARRIRRPALRADLLDIIRWAEVDLSPERPVGPAVTMSDVDAWIEPIESYGLLLENSSRPGRAYATDPAQIPYLVEMAAVFHGQPVFPQGPDFMTSPLTFGDRLAAHTAAAIRAGKRHFGGGVMPIGGGNAPVTVAGIVVMAAAEMLGMWLLIRSLAPEATFGTGACCGILDLRKGTSSFNAPEALLADLGVCELFNRRYGGGVCVAAGPDYIDATLPGIQAAHERTCRAMAIAAFVGEHFRLGGQGTLAAGQIFSPEQFIVERDMGEGLWRLGQGIEVDDENIGLEAIEAIGTGGDGSFLDSDHTLRHFREVSVARGLYRGVYTDDATEHARDHEILEAAHRRYRDAISLYVPPPRDDAKVNELRRIVARAKAARGVASA